MAGTAHLAVPDPLDMAARFRNICCKAFEMAGGIPAPGSENRHSELDSAGRTFNSNFSVCRMTVSFALTPICSPTRTLCR